jgi:hypothetical protein
VTTAATLALAAYWLGRKGLWIALVLSVFSLITRSLLYRRHGVIKPHDFGAMIELAETLALMLLASI